jgi:hypothetical protein
VGATHLIRCVLPVLIAERNEMVTKPVVIKWIKNVMKGEGPLTTRQLYEKMAERYKHTPTPTSLAQLLTRNKVFVQVNYASKQTYWELEKE